MESRGFGGGNARIALAGVAGAAARGAIQRREFARRSLQGQTQGHGPFARRRTAVHIAHDRAIHVVQRSRRLHWTWPAKYEASPKAAARPPPRRTSALSAAAVRGKSRSDNGGTGKFRGRGSPSCFAWNPGRLDARCPGGPCLRFPTIAGARPEPHRFECPASGSRPG